MPTMTFLARLRLFARRAVWPSLFLVLALLGAALAVGALGTLSVRWRAFTLEVSVAPVATTSLGAGQTRLSIPPLGEVRARTHAGPLRIHAELTAVELDELKGLALRPPPRAALEKELLATAGKAARELAIRLTILGALGGLLAPILWRSRRAREWLAGPLLGALAVVGLLVLTRTTFRADAFRKSPTYAGSLRQAPWAIALAQNAVSNTEALGARLRNVSTNLGALYGRIDAAARDPAGDAGTISVLHVSDIHNNPAAIAFVKDLAREFSVAAVIDTGDLSDFGTGAETQAMRGLGDLRVPYVFVAGNHDSQTTVRAVERDLRGVILRAGDKPVEVAGLRLIGSPDPSSERAEAGSVDTPEAKLTEADAALKIRFEADKPDLVCVHNPRQAASLVGVAPVILCGHLHRAYVEQSGEKGKETVVCNAGTTGAAGARYFERPEGVPLSAAVLHFSRPKSPAERPRLLSVDLVVLQGSLRQYSITRHALAEAAPSNDTPTETR
jgi:predicted phosphodiesterase